jgi:hypothetical protein
MASRTAGLPEVSHARQMQQQGEAGAAFDERANRGAVETENQITFPVAWHRAVVGFRGPLTEHDFGAHKRFATACARPRHP